MKNTFGKYMWL